MNLFRKTRAFQVKKEQEHIKEHKHTIKKPNPTLPQKLTKTQIKILLAATERGEVIGGSFAQKTLYPESRKFNDIDIISKNPKRTAEHIQSKLKMATTAEMGRHGKYTIKRKTSGKVLADVVPLMYYERYKKYGEIPTYNVNGVKVLREDILYREKMRALKYGNPKLHSKLIKDVNFLNDI